MLEMRRYSVCQTSAVTDIPDSGYTKVRLIGPCVAEIDPMSGCVAVSGPICSITELCEVFCGPCGTMMQVTQA